MKSPKRIPTTKATRGVAFDERSHKAVAALVRKENLSFSAAVRRLVLAGAEAERKQVA